MTFDLRAWPMSMPGSKRRMIEKLWPNIPRPYATAASPWSSDIDGEPMGRFIVPFFGTGVDSGYFSAKGFEVLASDAQPLIVGIHNDFEGVARKAGEWIEAVRPLPVEAQKIAYLDLRARHNLDPLPWSLYALCKTARSQMIRHNRKGGFNSPFGEIRKIPAPEAVASHVAFVKSIDGPTAADFADTMKLAQLGDVVYLDPPYLKTFNGYTGQPFSTDRLLDEIANLQARGVSGAMSNSPDVLDKLADHGLIDGENVKVHRYTRAGTIAPPNKNRQPVAEVLVTWKGTE